MLKKPTEAEWSVLQVLWAKGPSTVRTVNDVLNQKNTSSTHLIGYTTTLKIMQIMAEKGWVSRDESRRTHIYKAEVSEEDTQKRLLDKFVQTTFKGSAMTLVMQLFGNHKTSSDELDQIRAFLKDMEEKK